MTTELSHRYEEVCRHARQTALLGSIESLLGWDERTKMPPAAGLYRAEQITYLSGLVHERWIDPRWGDWLSELAESPLAADHTSDVGATIYHLKRKYDKKVKLPKSLVEELTRTSVLGQQAWQQARAGSDFAQFRPLLEKTIHLKRQQADALGYTECRYDALLDDYEPEELTSQVASVLAGLREALVPFVREIAESGRQADIGLLERSYAVNQQETFGRWAAEKMGFDFDRGRLDVTTHPFCTTIGPHDCRITTRYDKHHFPGAFFGILHEAGHGMYEQGLPAEQHGLPLGEAVSLGVHESQSRLWENQVGRSRACWEYLFPEAQRHFPQALSGVALDEFYFAINDVRPSLIRVEADEATYNLHILIRFELEQALIEDQLRVDDLPGAWNERYHTYLGIDPPDDAQGVLQDIHWSAGLIGYFPTYSLGNLYAAQLKMAAQRDLGDLDDQFRRGEFSFLLNWLREKVHSQGCRYRASKLIEQVAGEPISHEPLVGQLRAKLGPLYGLN